MPSDWRRLMSIEAKLQDLDKIFDWLRHFDDKLDEIKKILEKKNG